MTPTQTKPEGKTAKPLQLTHHWIHRWEPLVVFFLFILAVILIGGILFHRYDVYGYSAEEFSRMNIFDLCKSEFTSQVFSAFRSIQESGSMRFDSIHKRKNGEEFPVELSIRALEIDGRKSQQSIIRDILETIPRTHPPRFIGIPAWQSSLEIGFGNVLRQHPLGVEE